LPVSEYREWLVDLQGITLGSLEVVAADGNSVDLLRYLADDGAENPAETLERAELRRVVAAGIEKLPEIEQTVLALYFDEELTLAEIGEVVELHTSRVCQIKTQALARLRAHLRRHWK
jgi:RNA polymerase sigma factor for flagellar operon FliA